MSKMTKTLTCEDRNGKLHSVTTEVCDVEAAQDVLDRAKDAPDFAVDIARKIKAYDLRLRSGKPCRFKYSSKQAFWVHKIRHDLIHPTKTVEATPLASAAEFKEIEGLLTVASGNLKNPKVRLNTHALGNGGTQEVVLSRCGPRSRYAGAINLTDGRGFGQNLWFGRIETNGSLTKSKNMTPEVEELLKLFASNPAQIAADYGKYTGRCCFCNRQLEDQRSLDQGYGPICANNYGLPWGGKQSVKKIRAGAKRVEIAIKDAMDKVEETGKPVELKPVELKPIADKYPCKEIVLPETGTVNFQPSEDNDSNAPTDEEMRQALQEKIRVREEMRKLTSPEVEEEEDEEEVEEEFVRKDAFLDALRVI